MNLGNGVCNVNVFLILTSYIFFKWNRKLYLMKNNFASIYYRSFIIWSEYFSSENVLNCMFPSTIAKFLHVQIHCEFHYTEICNHFTFFLTFYNESTAAINLIICHFIYSNFHYLKSERIFHMSQNIINTSLSVRECVNILHVRTKHIWINKHKIRHSISRSRV